MTKLKKIKDNFIVNDKLIYMLALILSICAFLLFYKGFLSHRVTGLMEILLEKSVLEESLILKNKNLNEMNKNLLILDELKKSTVPRLISSSDEDDAVLHIFNMIEEMSLSEKSFKILPRELSRETGYLRPLQFEVAGNYYDCIRFLDYLQKGEYYYLPRKVEMSLQKDEGIYMSVFVYLIAEDNLEDFKQKGEFEKNEGNLTNPFFYAR